MTMKPMAPKKAPMGKLTTAAASRIRAKVMGK